MMLSFSRKARPRTSLKQPPRALSNVTDSLRDQTDISSSQKPSRHPFQCRQYAVHTAPSGRWHHGLAVK